jgi:hypothetical protein
MRSRVDMGFNIIPRVCADKGFRDVAALAGGHRCSHSGREAPAEVTLFELAAGTPLLWEDQRDLKDLKRHVYGAIAGQIGCHDKPWPPGSTPLVYAAW